MTLELFKITQIKVPAPVIHLTMALSPAPRGVALVQCSSQLAQPSTSCQMSEYGVPLYTQGAIVITIYIFFLIKLLA